MCRRPHTYDPDCSSRNPLRVCRWSCRWCRSIPLRLPACSEHTALGLFNAQKHMQRAALGMISLDVVQVYIIEANPRASRTVPFVAKAIGHPLAAYASLLMSGKTLADINFTEEPVLNHVAVKEAVLPFEKFPGAPTALTRGVELSAWRCCSAYIECGSGSSEASYKLCLLVLRRQCLGPSRFGSQFACSISVRPVRGVIPGC